MWSDLQLLVIYTFKLERLGFRSFEIYILLFIILGCVSCIFRAQDARSLFYSCHLKPYLPPRCPKLGPGRHSKCCNSHQNSCSVLTWVCWIQSSYGLISFKCTVIGINSGSRGNLKSIYKRINMRKNQSFGSQVSDSYCWTMLPYPLKLAKIVLGWTTRGDLNWATTKV